MAGLASLKNNIERFLTPDDQPNEVLIFSMTRENLSKTQKSLQNYINALETDNSSYTNEDRTMYLDKLYKIRNAFENRMITIMNTDAQVAYGGISYKRRSKMRSKRRSSRRNKRTKRRNKQTKRRR
jgi:hypothetical protein